MKLFDKSNAVTFAHKTKRPRMSWTQGRAWEYQRKTIDGHPVKFHYEVRRGTRMHFQRDESWYAAKMFQDNDPFEVHVFTTQPTAYGPDHCGGCDCVLTSADRERGACTSCGKSLSSSLENVGRTDA